MSGFTPANQVRLTNVATVRLQKKGKRFEIACYRNKVLSWRNKLETDLKEVLQIGTVFTNVSKGMLASSKDLTDAFGTSEQMIVCQEILEKGEMQVSEQERVALHETVFRDIASIVAEKTVNPNNNLPYTITMIQNAMRQIQFSVNLSKSSKSQALEVIRKLKDIMPITRASMLIRIVYGISDQSAVANEIDKIGGQIVQKSPSLSDTKEECYVDVRIDPEYYRRIEDLVKELGFGRVEVIQMRMAGAVAPGNVSAMVLLGGDAVSIPSPSGQDTKEGDDVDYSGSTNTIGDSKTTTTTNNNKPKADKGKSGKGRSKNRADDLNGLLAQVGLNDFKNADSDEESFDEYLVVNASKSKKKAKKSKIGKSAAEPARDGSDMDEFDDEGEDDHEESVSIAESTSVATTNVSTTAIAGNSAKQKVSKKEKRMEKELQKDREEQARALQDRLLRQKKELLERQQQQISTSENISSADSSKNEESDTAQASNPVTAPPATTVSTSGPLSSSTDAGASAASALSGKVLSCNTCGGVFYDSKLYRDHFKSDWHRFNLKRKMKNLPPVTSEEEFMNLPLSELQLT